ncbi:MAG: hypothetical protein EXR21_00035 [Flavobacteriaceae bacterium]|nr:hypothetical protein [Flavobacteriaceae bacterium]
MQRIPENYRKIFSQLFLLVPLFFVISCSSKKGCTDAHALNFESAARFDDSSCSYKEFSQKPDSFLTLKSKFNETSGLVFFGGRVWTHNDGGGEAKLTSIDTTDGNDKEDYELTGELNIDWEDVTSDAQYVYVGDFGNNTGNRTDLVIYRISKLDSSLVKKNNKSLAEEIKFSYADQTDYRKNEINNYDCEAMVASGGSLYLFTKCWKDLLTRVYKLSNIPGTYKAELVGIFNTKGLVSAADISPDGKTLGLTAYNPYTNATLLWVFRDFESQHFLTGHKYKVATGDRTFGGQIEGICFYDNNNLYLSSEAYGILSPYLYKMDISKIK